MAGSYRETLAALYALEARRGMDFRLERLAPVLEALGHPERAFAAVHLAGTNGKGSTASMIEAALRAGGYATGLYSSPHLVSFRERIRVGGEPISQEAVVRHVETIRVACERAGASLTFFEIATIAAFLEMRERGVEVAVIEAGLGGRLDATNVVDGDVAVITSIAIEHAEYLGGTLASIASEKAGIIKRGTSVVCGALAGEAMAEIERKAKDMGARLRVYGRDFEAFEPMLAAQREGRGLAGEHQARNAALAAAAVEALARRFPVDEQVRDAAIAGVRWPGRMEMVAPASGSPLLVMDSAHNPAAAEALAVALDASDLPRPRVLLFAAMADKDWRAMLAALLPCFDAVVLTAPPMARAERPERFLEAAPQGRVVSPAHAALAEARGLATAHGSVVVTGSIFLLGHLYRSAGGRFLEPDLED